MNRIATPSKVNLPTGSGKQVPGNKLRASALNLYQIAAAFGVSFTFAATLTTAEAGDILRGGAPMGAPRGGRGAGSVSEAGTARARANAKDALSRTTQAVQAVQAMQTAARGVARSGSNNLGLSRSGRPLPNVPNGLVTGGLQVAPGVPVNLGKPVAGEDIKLWQGAMLPSQSVSGGKTTVTIKQTSQQALLNWKTFNIGKETTLKFDQSKGGASQSEWIAFNKIVDPTGVPSQVLGSIEASGQVYVLNQNGIIFGGSSQVNTHALVASSLPINNGLVNRGLLNNPDGQFLFSARVTDPTFLVSAETPTYTLAQKVADGTSPSLSYSPSSGVFTALKAGTDYTLKRDAEGRTIVTATPEGIARIGSATLTATYSVPGGDVVVKKGAILSSPTTPEHIGGRISLFAPNVLNEGTILTPDGQTLLAAGRQIALVGHQSGDPSLRGLDVYVGVVDQNSGVARNTGLIQAPRASVGISGKTVDQLGTIDSSTSVSLNGRVDLLASYNAVANPGYDPAFPLKGLPFLFKSTGTVTLGAESITRIVPELLDTETVVGTRLALASKVNVQGHAIHLASNALLLAPNAEVTLSAGTWDFIPSVNKPLSNFVYAGGQIYLDRGATINVAGTVDVEAPMSQNILSLELRGAELADAPLQRTGVLRGTTLNIDIRQSGLYNGQSWIGTPLGNAAGFVNLIERNVAALTTAGGTVALRAGESVVMQSGAKIDVSGGWTNFEGGLVETTRVMSDGQILDISQATPDRVYQGIYTGTHTVTHSKYGISETFSHPLALSGSHYEAAYIQGANGGSIAITAPSMALDGTLLGNTISGPRQRAIPPVASALSLGFTSQEPIAPAYFASAPTPPNITFQRESNLPPAQPFALDELGKPLALPSERRNALHLSPELLTINGFGTLNIENSDGTIFVPANIELASRAGGSITLSGRAIDIEGSVVVPGGSLS
ncbi:MAG: filamentous hemagglutinin N-terminal domain-containing protein, partial [Verrucomicrobiota bacterium]